MTKNSKTFDYLIVGGGIIGVSIALRLLQRRKNDRIVIIEKEDELGEHASGKNSGVLHGGIYYAPGSLKAKLCVKGRKLLTEYCDERNLPIKRCGKIIIPINDSEKAQLQRLCHNATQNGVNIDLIDGKAVREISEDINSDLDIALFSPDTAVVDSKLVLKSLAQDFCSLGGEIWKNSPLSNFIPSKKVAVLGDEHINYGSLINCAGAYADKIAHTFGVGLNYGILPFRGSYWRLNPDSDIKIPINVYPVPDPRMPFLGVHFTPSVHGEVFIGPNAMPALGREHYRGFSGIKLRESVNLAHALMLQYLKNQDGIRHGVRSELGRIFKFLFIRQARKLIPKLEDKDVVVCSKRGIRAQLIDRSHRKMVMDFVVEKGESSLHVLNAVSPAFTCGLSFAEYVIENYIEK